MNSLELFFLLQILDFLTTLVGLRMGGSELNPFISWLMQLDAVMGLTAVKLLGVAIAGYCVWRRKLRVIGWVNYYFAGLVIWNLLNILRAVTVLA